MGIVGKGILQDEDAVAHVLALGVFHAGELVGLVHIAVKALDDPTAIGEGDLVGASLAAVGPAASTVWSSASVTVISVPNSSLGSAFQFW